MLSSLHTIFPPHLGFSPLRSDGANYAMRRGGGAMNLIKINMPEPFLLL